jgi:hypothetical protein
MPFYATAANVQVVIARALICCGIGGLVAFVFGWIKSSEWNAKGIMLIWTIAIIAGIVLGIVHPNTQMVQLQQQIMQMQQPK